MRFEDLTGKQFGMLTPIKRVRKENSKQTYWLCKCRCGNETHTMSEWSAILGIRYTTLAMRLNRYGWDTEKAFSTPTKGKVM